MASLRPIPPLPLDATTSAFVFGMVLPSTRSAACARGRERSGTGAEFAAQRTSQCIGWFQLIALFFFRVQSERRFWEIDVEILHTRLTFPCRTVDKRFSSSVILVLYFFAYLGLEGSSISSNKNKNKNKNIRKKLDRCTLNTCENFRGSQKRRGHLAFCAVNVQKSRLRLVTTPEYLVSVKIRF